MIPVDRDAPCSVQFFLIFFLIVKEMATPAPQLEKGY
jgi:hypothetical protein